MKKNVKHAKKEKKIVSECNFIGIKNNRLHYKCKECNDELYKSINGLIEKFLNTYRFCNGDVNKFVLLLRKGIYPYEYVDSWEKFNETLLPDKKYFYSNLNKEGITDKDYVHAQKVWAVFEIKNLGDYHDLYVQSDKCLKTLEMDVLRNINLILLIFCLRQD